MKKLILLFAFLFTVSSSFMSCRDRAEGETEVLDDDYATEVDVLDDEVGENGFGDYDMNRDGFWDSDEFGEAYDEDWTTWDADGDGYLNDNEFYYTYYGWVDADDDDLIDEEEWNIGYNNLYGDYADAGDFAALDLDNDGFLDRDEWYEGWRESEWFNDYDLDDDGLVDNEEWDDGLFATWDDDDDGMWDEDDYNNYTIFYDTW